jgi:CheY-like chemotaxis protein
VYDTGPGIPAHQQQRIYGEFHRLEQDSPWGEKGLGLGLSICDRLARLLSHELSLASRPGKGSGFGVRVTREPRSLQPHHVLAHASVTDPIGMRGLRVLCVDNDSAILDGMEALLGGWGVSVLKARGSSEALALAAASDLDAVLVDYHLNDGSDGLELLRRLNERRDSALAGGLITADHGAHVALAARAQGYPLLHKPIRPAALRALLAASRRRRAGRAARRVNQALPAGL